MLTINVICIGKLKESYLKDAQAEYTKRLGAFCKLNIIELNESRLSDNPNDVLIAKCLEQEGLAIISKLKGFCIPMCIEGQMQSSQELAQKFENIALNASEISFVIGGSYGLSNTVKQKADYKLSLSKMTFPHQLARVMLLEQIYRCFQINSNGKYHK